MRKLLLIDDDRDNLSLLTSLLSDSYDVVTLADSRNALPVAVHEAPDLICVDLHMPAPDGIRVCRTLRAHSKTQDIPIIMVSMEASIDKRVQALNCGADDYLQRPFRSDELLARLSALLRRSQRSKLHDEPTSYDGISLDPATFTLNVNGRSVRLTPTQFDLLKYFLTNGGRIISRQELLGQVWADVAVGSRTVDAHLVTLRKHLQGTPLSLSSVHGVGFVLDRTEMSQ